MTRALLAALGLLLTAGCSGQQSSLSPAGDQAGSTLTLFTLMLWICGIVYCLVLAFLGWGIWRAIRRKQDTTSPATAPDDMGLSRGLWGWAAMILIGLTIFITASFLVERSLASARGHQALEVRITAHQWWWRIAYREPGTGRWVETANELHLPLGKTARVTLDSSDVIHSFWVPNVAGKMDVIPGRRNVIDLTPRRIGWFRGQCAEFCGAQHAHMALDVKIEEPEDFGKWLTAQNRNAAAPTDPIAIRGARIATTGPCGQCHVVRGTPAQGRAGPDLTHIASRRSIAAGTLPMSRGALQGWISQPQALKPGTMMPAVTLAPADLNAVTHYLETLQ